MNDSSIAAKMAPSPAISLSGVNLSLGRDAARVHILKDIDLHIGRGEAVGLVGPSGSGKTTLLMVLAGLERADTGSIVVAGADLRRLNEDALAPVYLASAEGLPVHVIGMEFLAEAMTDLHANLVEGDAFLHNDPYLGNTHPADHVILVPVFWEGRHVFTAAAKAHQADCGNAQPTTYMPYAHSRSRPGAPWRQL